MGLRVKLSVKTKLAVLFLATILFVAVVVVLLQLSNPVSEEQTTAEVALAFIKDVARIDIAKYQVNLTGHNTRNDMHGGLPTEMFKYTLESETSKLNAIIDFLNGTFRQYTLYIDEGAPFYTKPVATVLDEAKGTFERFHRFSGISYPADMRNLLDSLSPSTTNTTLESNNLKLTVSVIGTNTYISLFHMENGIDYLWKGVSMTFENRNLKAFGNGWSLYAVGNSNPSVSREDAVKTAIEAAQNYKLNITLGPNNTVQPAFTIDTENIILELASAEREPLTLQLLWTTHLYLEKPVYSTYAFVVSQWADSREIRYISPISGGVTFPPEDQP
ncbi:MAG TPA: hypothetical protein VJ507_04090 [Candidatus Bathyarchaeia archaeon]|nr:hypothetical protein [Candidatus Bathyarchaeia archaeon]